MAKNKFDRKANQNRPSLPAQAPPAPPSNVEATVSNEQSTEIDRLTAGATETGAAPLSEAAPLPGVNVAQAIKRAQEAERIFRAAQKRSEDAATQAEQAARALEQQSLSAKQALERQQGELAREKSHLAQQKKMLDERDSGLLERETRMVEREQNAEGGFLNERRRIVAELEEQVKQLRETRQSFASAIEAERAKEEEGFRRRLDERSARFRQEEDERAARWRQEDETRAAAAAKARRAEAVELERELSERRTLLKEEASVIELQRRRLDDDLKKQRNEKADLSAARELLAEDVEGFEKKVQRFAAARVAELEAELAAERARLGQRTEERDRYWRELEAHNEQARRRGDKTDAQVNEHVEQLEREVEALRSKVRAGLGEASAQRLDELEKERTVWLEERAVKHAKLADAEARVERLRIAGVELETQRDRAEALETTRRLLQAALKDLGAEVDKYTKADDERNPMEALRAHDRDVKLQSPVRTRAPVMSPQTLATFAADLRHGIAAGLDRRTLFYSERDVRCFLGGLAMSRLLLLQGISGTGKTSLPLAFAKAIGAEHEVVEVQAGWRDRQDLVGYYNAFHRHFYATNFLQALYRAGTPANRDRPFLIVLDEVNLSRVEQFFADFLSALELPENERRLTLLNDPVANPPALMVEKRHLPLPSNVWFIGTANHDETTTGFADKTYDRAHIMELPRRDPTRDDFKVNKPWVGRDPISFLGLTSAFSDAQKKQEPAVARVLDWLRDPEGIAPLLDKRFRVGWGNRLERDVQLFVPVVIESGGSASEALDHLLATKVLRKLRDRHDVTNKGLVELEDKLKARWTKLGGVPERSLDLLGRERDSKHAGNLAE